MDAEHVIKTFEREAMVTHTTMTQHPHLSPFFEATRTAPLEDLRAAYLRWLKVTAGYVRFTRPMLSAAANALHQGTPEDQLWSAHFLSYANEETDAAQNSGHEAWALQDMKSLEAEELFIATPYPETTNAYGKFFVERSSEHPYAILGAKGLLEHLSLANAPAFAAGLRRSGIPNIESSLRFITSHNTLDIAHVREANDQLRTIKDERILEQVLEGTFFASGLYRMFLEDV